MITPATSGRSWNASFSPPSPQAEEKTGQSRIYLGIHWAFDKTEGIAQGRRVAECVFKHMLQPRRDGETGLSRWSGLSGWFG